MSASWFRENYSVSVMSVVIFSTANSLERLNKEIKRRTRVIGIFPNDDSITRLVGALAAEQAEEWHVTRRYMNQGEIPPSLTEDEAENVA